jgi:hypothetical protein
MTKMVAVVALEAIDRGKIGTARIAAHNRQEMTMSDSPIWE